MLKDRLEKNWNYLQSWKDKHNAYHGIISTYWESSKDITLPHVMNHFPVIEGFTHLIDKFGIDEFKSYAIEDGEFLLSSFDVKTGLFSSAWGDTPGRDTGVVHQSAAAGAMVELSKITNDEKYLKVAIQNFKVSRERWPGILLNGVANQVLKYIHGLMRLKEVSITDYKPFEKDVHKYIKQLKTLIYSIDKHSILIDQSAYSELLMTVYEAKCLHGLLALYKNDIEKQWAEDTIIKLLNGINEKLYLGNGQYMSHIDYKETGLTLPVKFMAALGRRVLQPEIQINIEGVRKRFKRKSGIEYKCIGPVWLSRIADFAYILNKTNTELGLNYQNLVDEINNNIDTHQLSNGGVPNATGPWSSGLNEWQRFICSTRWNAYVFRNYCYRVTEKPELNTVPLKNIQWGDETNQVEENAEFVKFNNYNNHIVWRKPV